ncbi:maleylpyruvate isomerase N-terminal domain-containing protein [Propionicimonas sp.]|uniref:maleylpyruvate isomerase N-terminal domain-containing protein n=1 Tax=Propionicimonas sp. TaxID=1955623 RepID=UPI001D5D7070|nr:maleylpyruvate isomerase N-terminal domain-containing protein [Propionicimonas sp.]MBU3977611.1 maleylpyruvate isomerase family mycothiol-dependent enzyme [Actinomycetota bacterium]MBU3987085.1 maleylpyruvate isomerase family mycothiol-dependent enzyme [Actinomycetota bacterium]MBU4008906.1 maleylpyruvate isomerase family mycothiol-dependent enzyme [Actinomycetota bacterium]MBU4065944.1 maleylpyruvate isomerase family mycothiol-dependent enzyme [Actinomycetota bacterium]MBU4093392.1 maleylp
MSLYPGPVPVADVHRWKTEATQRLLGYTIALTEDEWHQPARLPGWSRAHVATHLARNADYFRAVLNAQFAGCAQPELPSAAERRANLELGADRNGLELQIDLDAAAGALQNAIDTVSDWTPLVLINGAELPLAALPLARLHELEVHLIDLDCGFTAEMIDPEAAEWLLRWALFRLGEANLPAMTITTTNLQAELGMGTDEPLQISGSDASIWAWLTGRGPADSVSGSEDLTLPFLG